MFRRLSPLEAESEGHHVTFEFENQTVQAQPGDTVAAALLAAGFGVLRSTPVSEAPRAPWCMMGICFDCLVEIDGMPNCQACQVVVVPGMRVFRQRGARRVSP